MEIVPRPDGLITTDQAATLCGVSAVTVRQWASRGYLTAAGDRVKLPVARREGRALLLNPVEVAKAEHATRERARRHVGFPSLAAA
jgi:hypothetical protein